jgi:RIO kinase 2
MQSVRLLKGNQPNIFWCVAQPSPTLERRIATQSIMKLDPTVMRTMDRSDFRVLEAVETGMRHHAVVPASLIHAAAGLRHGGSHKLVSSLLRDKLLSHENHKGGLDGYRLTNAGYDILALHNLKVRGVIGALGQRIGTGKESDIYLAAAPNTGRQIVLKFHRLGRTSFRNVRNKRDYFNNQKQSDHAHNWLFLSKLSAVKEFAFMKALYESKYPTPTPLAQNRHIIAMSLVRGLPLYQIYPKQLSVEVAADIYEQAVGLASRLASHHGLVHCDLNEFNLLVDLSGIQALVTDDGEDPYVRHSGQSVAPEQSVGALSKPAWEQSLHEAHGDALPESLPEPAARLPNGDPKPVVTLIDFPQMISTRHVNAQEYYERDVACLTRFFVKKLQCHIPEDCAVTRNAAWDVVSRGIRAPDDAAPQERLDRELRASGFSATDQSVLELYYFTPGPKPIASAVQEGDEDSPDEDGSSEQEDDDQDEPSVHDKAVDEHVRDVDDGSEDDDDGNFSRASYVSDRLEQLSLLDVSELQALTRQQLAEVAKDRVRRQLEDQRRKTRNLGAFRRRNINKSYAKGKRVLTDALL